MVAAAAAKSLQSCLTLRDPIDSYGMNEWRYNEWVSEQWMNVQMNRQMKKSEKTKAKLWVVVHSWNLVPWKPSWSLLLCSLIVIVYLLLSGCAGSPWLRGRFLELQAAGAALQLGSTGFPLWWPLLFQMGSRAWLSICGTQAWLPCSKSNLPRPGIFFIKHSLQPRCSWWSAQALPCPAH